MSSLIINRSSEYTNRARVYNIILDDIKAGTIKNGATEQLTLESGLHTLKFTIDWCSSATITFMIHDGETKHFDISAFKNSKKIMPVLLGLAVLNMFLLIVFKLNILNYVFIALAPVIIYKLSVGRKSYLTLVEKD